MIRFNWVTIINENYKGWRQKQRERGKVHGTEKDMDESETRVSRTKKTNSWLRVILNNKSTNLQITTECHKEKGLQEKNRKTKGKNVPWGFLIFQRTSFLLIQNYFKVCGTISYSLYKVSPRDELVSLMRWILGNSGWDTIRLVNV